MVWIYSGRSWGDNYWLNYHDYSYITINYAPTYLHVPLSLTRVFTNNVARVFTNKVARVFTPHMDEWLWLLGSVLEPPAIIDDRVTSSRTAGRFLPS